MGNVVVRSGSAAAQVVKFNFYGDELDVVSDSRGQHWVTLSALCQPLGLTDHKTQVDKLKRAEWATTGIIPAVAEDGKVRNVFCLNIRSVSGWLFTVNAGKVRPEAKDKLVRYQRECAEMLADHFIGKRGASNHSLRLLSDKVRVLEGELRVARLKGAEREFQTRALAASQRSTIGDAELTEIRDLTAHVADMWLALGRAKSSLSALNLVKHRAMPGCFGKGFRLRSMPRAQVPDVLRALHVLRSDALEELARRRASSADGSEPLNAAPRGATIHKLVNLRK